MQLKLKNILFTNIILKTISGILGCTLWYLASQSHTTTTWLDVPVCFYGQQTHQIVQAPHSIAINISGKRTDLASLDVDALALHIDVATLRNGPNAVVPNNTNLFLPETIKVLHYNPSNTIISMNTNEMLQPTVA